MPITLPPVDDEVFEALQALAVPLVDDVNTVLRRLLGLADQPAAELPAPQRPRRRTPVAKQTAPKVQRAARGTTLPDSDYEEPLLSALHELGGKAPAAEVIDGVGRILDGRLAPADRQKLASGDVRWRNRVQFARLRLINNGELAKDSPRGTWTITAAGRQRIGA